MNLILGTKCDSLFVLFQRPVYGSKYIEATGESDSLLWQLLFVQGKLIGAITLLDRCKWQRKLTNATSPFDSVIEPLALTIASLADISS